MQARVPADSGAEGEPSDALRVGKDGQSPVLLFCHSWLGDTLIAVRLAPITVVHAPFSADEESMLRPAAEFACSVAAQRGPPTSESVAGQAASAAATAAQQVASQLQQRQQLEAQRRKRSKHAGQPPTAGNGAGQAPSAPVDTRGGDSVVQAAGFNGAFRYDVTGVYIHKAEAVDDGGVWAVAAADFLIKTLLMGSPAPSPLPPHCHDNRVELQQDVVTVAMTSFQLFGRAATAVTFDNAVPVPPFTAVPSAVPSGTTHR